MSMVWPTLGSRTAKEQEQEQNSLSGVLGGIRGYTAYTNLRGLFDSVYSPQ